MTEPIFEFSNDNKICHFRGEDYEIFTNLETGERYINAKTYMKDVVIEENIEVFLIEYSSQVKNRLKDSNIQFGFANCLFLITADFKGEIFNRNITFNNAIFMEEVNFLAAKFSQNVMFHFAIFNKKVNFEFAVFNEKFSLLSAVFREEVSFLMATFVKESQFTTIDFIEKSDFTGAKFLEKTDFTATTFYKNANFNGSSFSKKSLFGMVHFIEEANFNNIGCGEKISFPSTTFEGNVNFNEAHFKSASFFDIVVHKDIIFRDTVIDILTLKNVTFKNGSSIDLSGSIIEKFNSQEINQNDGKNEGTFLVLKKFSLKKHDQRKALSYYKKEMESHYKSLKWMSGDFFDKLILFFEHWVSNYGTNAILSISWIFGITFIFSVLIVGTTSLEVFLHIINPLSKYNDLKDILVYDFKSYLTWVNSLFLIHKLSLAVLTYETIKSFRKFSRKL